MKRYISFLLALMLVFGWAFPLAGQAQAATVNVTRAQWVQQLVQTFSMTVEEDNYPDNYFSDLTGKEEYYRDIIVAVEFGVIDLEAGLAFQPEEPATREFAAHTLNYCLGFQLEEERYTFSESASVTYPDDIQIAVNRGWFTLTGGAFKPEQAITQSEADAMLEDAAKVLAADEIDVGYNNSFVFADEVIELPEGTAAELISETKLVVMDPSSAISEGDIFAVYFDGLPTVYRADAVQSSGAQYTITVTKLELYDYLESVDAEGSMSGDLAQFEVAEGLDVIYVLEDGAKVANARAAGTKKIQLINFHEKFGDLDLTVELYDMKLDWYAKGNIFDKSSIDVSAVVTGKTFCSATLAFGASASDFTENLTLGTYPIGNLGYVTVTAHISIDGHVTVTYGANFKAGVAYSYYDGFRIPREFNKTHFSLTVEATIDMGVTAVASIYEVPFLSAQCSVTVGTKANFVTRYRGSDQTPKLCIHTDSWLYANAEASASVGIDAPNIPGAENFKKSWNKGYTVWDRNNSPVRSVSHFEDGTWVSSCSYGDTDFFGYNSYYYSAYGSRYGNGGVSSLIKPPSYTYSVGDDGTVTITGYSGGVSSLAIPSTIDGYTVTAIGGNAFNGHKELVSVTLPATVKTIGNSAFANCTNLKIITLSENLTSIDSYVFSMCVSLLRVDIPDSVTSLGNGVFNHCTNLSAVKLSNNLESTGFSVFANCEKLTAITIPKSLKTCEGDFRSYTAGNFYGCTSLKTVILEDGMTRIPGYLLRGCESLETISIPKSVKAIGNNVFEHCTGLTEIAIPDAVTTIEGAAFSECTGLTEVAIPDAVTQIHSNAFANCTGLEKITLSKNVEQMGRNVFANCTGLTEITIPKSLKSCEGDFYGYGAGIFSGCTNLKSVTLEEGMKKVPAYLFRDCKGMETITIPKSVESIGHHAFEHCTQLTEVIISGNVAYIEGQAFSECTGLTEITLPDTLLTIDTRAFNACSALETIVIPDSVTNIGEYVFAGCTSLTDVTLPNTRDWITAGMFQNCTSLEKIELPDTVTTIQKEGFKGCSSLSEITWSKSIISIGDSAFYNCSSLKEVKIPNTVTTINNSAFRNCDSLETITIPDSVTTFGDYMFQDSDALVNVKLGTGITEIKRYSFEHCDALESITIPYRVTNIADSAFKNCVKLTEITIPRATTSIASTVFSYPGKLTIRGVAGTYAETYAGEIGATFVAIDVPATSVKLDQSSLSMNKGTTLQLIPTIEPADFTDAVAWKSSNTNVATVSDNGLVKAVSSGEATISFVVGNVKATCKITVVQPVTRIQLNKSSVSLEDGGTFTLTATVSPNDAANKTITWSSSDENIAAVDQNGVVTAVSKGSTTITAAAQDGSGVTATCTIRVTNNLYTVTTPAEMASAHPYTTDCSDVWQYTLKDSKSLNVTFSKETSVEEGSDYIRIYDASGNQVGVYTGSELAGKTVTVPGDTVKIQLSSDGSYCEYGFAVTSITADPDENVPTDPTCTHTTTEVISATAATCTKTGLTAGVKCSVCGEILTKQETIPSTGHSWSGWTVYIEASYNAPGEERRTCSNCDEYESRATAMLSGWAQKGNIWYYYKDGSAQTGWQYVDGIWYYFGINGAMQTGWLQVGGTWYYLSSSGAMQTDWQQIDGIWYYFSPSGTMQTDWQQIGGIWYYFSSGGAMQTDWQQIGGTWYYFSSGGAMQTGWQQIGGTWYYFSSGGAMQTGWQQIGGTWYYFSSGGAMQTGWQYIGGKCYYFTPGGAMVTGNYTVDGKKYTFSSSGVWLG